MSWNLLSWHTTYGLYLVHTSVTLPKLWKARKKGNSHPVWNSMNTNCIGFCVLACIEECLKRSTLWRKLGQNQMILYQLGSHKDVKKSTILNWVKSSRNPFKCQCFPHIETSQLICYANQLTSFYTRTTLAVNGLSELLIQFEMVDFLTSLWDV